VGFSASFTSKSFSAVIVIARSVMFVIGLSGKTVDDTRVARAFDREVIEQDVVDGGIFVGSPLKSGRLLST